jgi:hypothetical protein
VPGCEVTDPVAAAGEAIGQMGKVDVVVALGDWDNDTAKALVAQSPVVGFVVPGTQMMFMEPKEVGSGRFFLGNGPKGKKLGMLNATLTKGASTWQTADPAAGIQERLDRYKKRLQEAQDRAAKDPNNEKVKACEQRLIALDRPGFRLATITIRYLRAARADGLLATATCDWPGRRAAHLAARCAPEGGREVAQAQAFFVPAAG